MCCASGAHGAELARRVRPSSTLRRRLPTQYWAYKLEFEGEDCFVRVWVASLGFFAASVWLLAQFAYSRCSPPEETHCRPERGVPL